MEHQNNQDGVIVFAKKITNNKTEDTIYSYSGTFCYADSVADMVKDNHLSKLEAQNARLFEVGKNISLSEAKPNEEYALMYELNNGTRVSELDIPFDIMIKTIIDRKKDICNRSVIIFKMSDCKDCKEALEIYNELTAKETIKTYMSVSEFGELLGVTAQTLRNWDKSNKLKPVMTTDDGRRLYTIDQSLEYFIGKKHKKDNGIGYVVKRENISESEQKIKNYFKTIGCNDYTIIADDKYRLTDRDNLENILKNILSGKISHLVVDNGNMAIPVGCIDLLEMVLNICGCKLHRVY